MWAWGGGSWGGLCSSTELGSNPSGWCFLGLQKSLIILPRASETAAVAPPVTSLRKAFEREQRAVRRTGESPGEGGGGTRPRGAGVTCRPVPLPARISEGRCVLSVAPASCTGLCFPGVRDSPASGQPRGQRLRDGVLAPVSMCGGPSLSRPRSGGAYTLGAEGTGRRAARGAARTRTPGPRGPRRSPVPLREATGREREHMWFYLQAFPNRGSLMAA